METEELKAIRNFCKNQRGSYKANTGSHGHFEIPYIIPRKETPMEPLAIEERWVALSVFKECRKSPLS